MTDAKRIIRTLRQSYIPYRDYLNIQTSQNQTKLERVTLLIIMVKHNNSFIMNHPYLLVKTHGFPSEEC